MSDRSRRSRPEDDDAKLLRDLHGLAADYEPDVTAIERRARRRPAPASRRLPTAIRSSRPVVLPAAAVLILIGGVVAVISSGLPDSERTSAIPITPATIGSQTPTPSPPSTSRSVPPATASTHRPKPAANPSAVTPPKTKATEPKDGPQTPQVKVAVRPVAPTEAGAPVDLTRSGVLDWVVVGARADLKQVRAKAGSAAPLITVDQPDTATSVDGPFSTSWSGGAPEQDHDAATRWLRVDGETGLTLVLAGSSEPRTLVLHVGTQDLRGRLSISGKGLSASRTALGPASSTAQGIVVTVSLPPTTGRTQIRLSGSADGTAPGVYLAAATLVSGR
jgi:hypothetical protein